MLVPAGLGLVLFAGVVWLLWRGPWWFDGRYLDAKSLRTGSAALVTGFRTTVVQIVAALGASIALLYTARNFNLTRRGQVTDRFTKALERLGSAEPFVCLGGVLALEQIVQDAPEQATHAAQVLHAFVRRRAPRRAAAVPPDPRGVAAAPLRSSPADEVGAALIALTRPASRRRVDPLQDLALGNLHLAGARLPGADLTGANLIDTNLARADLSRADLTRAVLTRANLTEANLIEAGLIEADLIDADLTRAALSDANLTRAYIYGANLTWASLDGAKLTGANLIGANLTGARLARANLTGANLARANLTGANLNWANLTGADLTGADLTNADLTNADLSQVLGLTSEQVAVARWSSETVLPEGMARPAVGPG
ncbi:uncharacterized protein YjbI with pentapeptide repeats [Streptomyces sp. 846.5]|nr:uncharacterized protein YjbI with pentapeptide repeats [Streptomyces sp. 846.5]